MLPIFHALLVREKVTNRHSQALRAEKILPIENKKQNTCGNASLITHYVPHDSHNALKSLYKAHVAGSAATLPKRTYSLHKKVAFTLAEVLITLGIIGVVAAMTLPALIANHQKKVASTKLKKFYSTMQNVLNFATLDYGEMRYWEFPTKQNDGAQMSKFATTYIFPYLQGVKQCNTTENSECFFYANKIFDQGLPVLYIFNDGSCFGMNIGGAGIGMGNIHIIYDYNCMQNPNKYGKDVFEFLINWLGDKYIFKGGGFSTRNMTTREELLNFCKNAQNTARGECASLIQFDNWEIKDDYPWY